MAHPPGSTSEFMRRIFALAALALLAVAIGAFWPSRPATADAEGVLRTMLAGTADAPGGLRDEYCWLEDCGIGAPLAPVPVPGGEYPRLLAGDGGGKGGAALYETGPDGTGALVAKLTSAGAKAGTPAEISIAPRAGATIKGTSTPMQYADGAAVVAGWQSAGRNFALLVRGLEADSAAARRDELLRQLVTLPGVGDGAMAPLLIEGRYAAVLDGWKRSGSRFYRAVGDQWLGLRMFAIDDTAYADIAALQLDVEAKLIRARFRRSAGSRPKVAGADAFLGEYYGSEGYVQRILYARLEGAYLVALMQGPEAARDEMGAQSEALARGIMRVNLERADAAGDLPFDRVRTLRCAAWQEGRRVVWGALFDDARGQPMLWRQGGVEWTVKATKGGQPLVEKAGRTGSSRDLNPLVDAQSRALELPADAAGEIELALEVGGRRASMRIELRQN